MINRVLPCLWVGVLLVACDKQRGADNQSGGDSTSAAARASRAARQEQPGRQQDLRAALAAAKKITSPAERDTALAEVGRAAIESNPNLVAEVIRHLTPESTDRVPLIKAMIAQLMKTDPPAADAWVASLESEKDRATGEKEIVVQLSPSDPGRAAELLQASGLSGGEFDRASARVLALWTSQTPADAVAWSFKLPAGESRTSAVKKSLFLWIMKDAQAAFAWVAQQKNSEVRTDATTAMAKALIYHPGGRSFLSQAEPAVRAELEQQMKELGGEPASVPRVAPDPAPEPVVEPALEPAMEPAPEPAVEPAPEPAEEPAMEPEDENGETPPTEDEEESEE
jgi:hypothetical protein